MDRTLHIILTILWVLLGFASGFPAVMSAFLFDAPGSDSNPYVIAVALALVALPFCWFAGAALTWIFMAKNWGKWFFALPALDLAAICLLFLAIDRFCGGNFSCH